jgi:transcriptional regulator with XRE-family HTH domain
MSKKRRGLLDTPDAARAHAESVMIGEVADTIHGLLREAQLKQKDLAERLQLTEGRASQVLAGTRNLTLKTLGSIGWALGVRFQLKAIPLANRTESPAALDPPAPAWLKETPNVADWSIRKLSIPKHSTGLDVDNPSVVVLGDGQIRNGKARRRAS